MSFAWSGDDAHHTTDVNGSYGSSSIISTQCAICIKSFGVRRRHRRRTCRRCDKKVCENCCSKKRFDFKQKQLIRVCDGCLKNEYEIKISHRINNLKLKSKRNCGIYVAKTLTSSREYKNGFVTNCRIIQINNNNVESFTAQQIANKLNLIKLPFKMTLDYAESDMNIADLKVLLQKRYIHNHSFKSMSVGLEPDSSSISFPHDPDVVNIRRRSTAKSCPGSPVNDVSFSFDHHEWDKHQLHHINYNYNDIEQEMIVSDASRQFCVVFERRQFKLLCMELRNGNTLFNYKHIDINVDTDAYDNDDNNAIHNIWSWYTVKEYTVRNRHIPVGSKLLNINGINMLNPMHWNKIDKYLMNCALPIIMIFEAPKYMKTLPRSQYIQYEYKHNDIINRKRDRKHKDLVMWWMEQGGFVLIVLIFCGFVLFESWRQFVVNRLYLLISIVLCIPNVASNLINWLLFGHKLYETKEKEKENNNRNASFKIVNEYRLNIHKHKHRLNIGITEEEEEETEERDEKKDSSDLFSDVVMTSDFDPLWERNICHSFGGTHQWGSYCLGSSELLHVRGYNYLNDKIKVESKQALFKIGYVEVFELHDTAHYQSMAQNPTCWFYRNRYKLPKHLFFFIFHLRLESLNCSIVIYWYIDKEKYKTLITSDRKISDTAKRKGNGYFCIGSNNYDSSGMFWNFINGECQYRNDRLKMIARKESGSWYLHIPSTPAIIGKKIPIIYYRAYDKKHYNRVKSYCTNSEQYEPYYFNALYHSENEKKTEQVTQSVPCHCGRCYWIDTEGKYSEYIELNFNPEAASPIAKNTIKMAAGVTKTLSWELHFLLEGQRNDIELPETVFANVRISHINLDRMPAFD